MSDPHADLHADSIADSDVDAHADARPDPQRSLAAATLFAMTRYVECPCAENALLVARHLECAAEEATGDPRLGDLCTALALRWRGHILHAASRQHFAGAH